MPGRVVTITALGNVHDLETSFKRAGLVVSDSANTMAESAKRAGATAAAASKEMGAAADAQAAAAGRAAAAVVESQAKMSRAQKAAADAAASAAKTAGASADEQVAAARRAADAQKASADQQIAAAKRTEDAHKSAAKAHTTISKVGGVVALGAVGAAVEAGKLGMAYQTAQASIQGATGQSVKSTEQLTGAFNTLGTGSQAAVGSGMQMESAYAGVAGQLKLTEGHALSTAEATKFSTAANNLAESGAANLAEAYSATAKVMQTYNLSADQAAGVTDTLYSTSKAVHVPVEAIASAMGKMHASLGTVAPSMQDVSGLMVSLAQHGLTGGKGIQVVGSAMQTLLGSSKPVATVLGDLGVKLTDSSGKFIGMQNAIALLQPKLAALPESERRYAEQTLLGKGATEKLGQTIMAGVPAFEAATAAGNKHAAAQKAAEAQSKTASDEMKALGNTVKTLGGDLGLILIPDLQKVAIALMGGIQWLEKHKAACIALGAVVTGVLGTAVAIFAYDKAVAFGKGVERMTTGLKSLVTSSSTTAASVEADQAAQAAAVEANAAKVEAANATASASFEELGPAAVSGTATVDGAVAGEAAAVTTADGTVDAANATAGASFMALLGPIALVTAAAYGAVKVMEKVTGGHVSELLGGNQPGESGKEGEAYAKAHGGYGTAAFAGQRSVTSLRNLGLSTTASQGVVKALMAESGGDLEKAASAEGNEGAYGIAQWLGSRRTGLEAFAKSKKQPKSNLEVQLEYLAKELKGPEHGTLTALQHAHGTNEAAGIFIKRFERPEVPGTVEQRAAGYSAPSPTSNAALQEQKEEAEGKRPKKKAAGAEKEYLGANNQIVHETAAQHAHKVLLEKKAKAEGKETTAAMGIPVGVATMLKTAESLVGAPYTSGGGHGSSANDPIAMLKQIGVDCSGFVSKVLSSGGVPGVSGLTTQGLSKNLAKGPGKYVTVEDRPEGSQAHTIIDVLGKWFESGGKTIGGKPGVKALTKQQAGEELAGGGFQAYHPAGLNAAVRGGLSATGLKQVTSAAEAAEKAETKRVTALEKAAKKMLGETTPRGSLASANQSATVPQLEKVLGFSSTSTVPTPFVHGVRVGPRSEPASAALARTFAGQPEGLSQSALEHQVMPTLAKSAEASGTGKAFDKMVAELRATHQAGMITLATNLVLAHKQALANLGRELYAVTREREAQKLTNESAEQKDRTTQTADLAAKELQVAKDSSTQVTDAMSASAKQIDDATTIIKDSFAEMVEAVNLATQKMSDAASGEVTKTQDTTAIEVAKLAERGKYGLDLIAQKLEVQLDQMKEQYDVQIQQAKMALDQAKISGQQLIAQKQLGMDLLQAHEDALIATAQAHMDAVQITQDQAEQTAQAQVDAAQIASDARADAVYMTSVNVASGTKAQQDAAKGMQAWATASGTAMMTNAEAHYKAVEATANTAIQGAQTQLALAQAEGQTAISNAQQALAQAEGSAKVAIANAEQGLTSIEDTAKVAEAKLEGQLAITREESQTQYAGSGLTIQQYGIDYGNATAAANEVAWALTHQIPV